jgi:hypothetical protein
MVLAGRLQILADGDEIDICGSQIVHQLQHFVPLFAQPHHDAGLGEHGRIKFLDPLQQPERMEVARPGTHSEIVAGHGFEIVVEHIGLGRDHALKRTGLAQEIRRQDFNRRLR